jgi:uncharacterized protein with PIN domain
MADPPASSSLPRATCPETSLPRFLLDGMLGTLTRRLRLLGLDASFLPDASDDRLLFLALNQGRVLLTRDRALAARLPDRSLLVAGDGVEDEFACLIPLLRSHRDALRPLTRCLACGGEPVTLSRDAALGLVPGYVHLTAPAFSRCPDCGRVYWEGTHAAGMRREVRRMMETLAQIGPNIEIP